MASGVPVVVPDTGGVLEYASRSNAWLAEPTATAFAAAIRAARRGDPARIAAASETARQFRWYEATLRYFDAYDDIYRRFAHTHSVEVGPRPGRLGDTDWWDDIRPMDGSACERKCSARGRQEEPPPAFRQLLRECHLKGLELLLVLESIAAERLTRNDDRQ